MRPFGTSARRLVALRCDAVEAARGYKLLSSDHLLLTRASLGWAPRRTLSSSTPSPKADEETKRLEQEIARLQAQLEEKKVKGEQEAEAATTAPEGAEQATEKEAPQETPASEEAAQETAQEAAPEGPVVLWEAKPLEKEFQITESLLNVSALASGSGLGMALLGIAPFTPPNPFMFGLLLAVVQVRLTHIWSTRLLRGHTRRHVTKLEQTITPDSYLIAITCDGGLTRTLRLKEPASDDKKPKPTFAETIEQGSTYISFDKDLGKAQLPAFNELMQSDRVIASEKIEVKPFEDESQEEAEKVVQRLSALSKEDLKKIQGKDGGAPKKSLASLRRSGQLLGSVILTSGLLICLSGRYSAEVQLSQT